MLNYFATSICKCVIQVVISTGNIEIFAQVSISILTKVHNSYLYLFKKRPIFEEMTNLQKICGKSQLCAYFIRPYSYKSIKKITFSVYALWILRQNLPPQS